MFGLLSFPDSPTDNDDVIDTLSDPPTRSQFIRDNPFRNFVRSGMALDNFSTLYYYILYPLKYGETKTIFNLIVLCNILDAESSKVETNYGLNLFLSLKMFSMGPFLNYNH